MPQIVKKRRSGWAILAVGALIASFLAVGAAPAAAIDEDSKQDHTATATACLGAALVDAGFTDLGSLEAAVGDINCLAYYGITTGRTADTFDPDSNVTRSQMALFLSRAAGVMDIDLSEGDMGADFGDIAELGQDRQDAIAALARNGIMDGRGDMAFDPGSDITRAEMAVALVNLIDKVSDNVSRNKAGLVVFGAAPGTPPNDIFDDAYASVSQPLNNAISAAYELGITTGYDDGTFRASASVPRRNMATFITRALGHSNVRPAGLTAQVDGGTITVSIRDAAFEPVVNEAVDAFRTAAAFESKAFKADGTCSSRTASVDAGTKCALDGADQVTDTYGNAELAQLGAEIIGKGLTVWVWTGAVGDKFGTTTDAFELSVSPTEASAPTASSATMAHDAATDTVHYGSTVTVTIQLQGDPDLDDDTNDLVDVGPGADQEISYSVVVEVFAGGDIDGTVNSRSTRTLEIGDGGSASFDFKVEDPDTTVGSAANMNAVRYTVAQATPAGEATFVPDPATKTVVYSDETPSVAAVTVKVPAFQTAPGANERTGAAADVTTVDQFGNPINKAGIVLTSDDTASMTLSQPRTTRGAGSVRIGYTYIGGSSDEVITATYVGADGMVGGGDDKTGTTTAYWVTAWETTTTGDSPNNGNQETAIVLSADLDTNQVVVTESGVVEPMSVNYDGNDFFTVDSVPSSMESFEEALGEGVAARVAALAASATLGTLTLAWESYVHDDPDDITSFTLVTK